MRKSFTIGTDPEFFLRTNKKYVSAIPHIPGTKYEPQALKCGATIQRDNVAVEFATSPAEDREQFVGNVKAALAETMTLLPKGHTLAVDPSAIFDPSELDDPEAQEFGCDPDFDAWKMEINEKPFCGNAGFRSCGAHIHVGGVDEEGLPIAGLEFLQDIEGKCRMVKMMDTFHGVISTLLDSSKAAVDRRQLYGKAGAHRPTPYGVEYRSLSNFWMKSPELVMLMHALTQDAINVIQKGQDEKLIETLGSEDIIATINTGNANTAKSMLDRYIRKHLSAETLDLLDLCLEKVEKYGDLKKEWKI